MGLESFDYCGGSTSLGFDFDIHGREFNSILGEAHEFYVKIKVKLILKELKDRLDLREGALLDVGCGTGLAEEFFGPCVQHLVGVDVAESMLQIAKGRRHANFVCADGLEMPFSDNTFDVTFSFALMHHLERNQRQQALKEIVRVTRPNGYVLTFEHNPVNPLTRYMVHKCSVDEGVELVHPTEMVRLHRDAGLRMVEVRYLIFFPKLLSILGHFESLLDWIPFGGQYEVVAKKAGQC